MQAEDLKYTHPKASLPPAPSSSFALRRAVAAVCLEFGERRSKRSLLERSALARFTGLLGLVVFLVLAYALSTDREGDPLEDRGLGTLPADSFRLPGHQVALQARSCCMPGRASLPGCWRTRPTDPPWCSGRLGTPGDALAVFAFAVLPTIIFVSAFFAVLYHLGIMQQIIKVVAWVMQRTMGTSGAESTNVAASIFMGQTEAPLTIRPFLNDATRSELMTIMTSGMAHVSGGIMAAYIAFGINAQDCSRQSS